MNYQPGTVALATVRGVQDVRVFRYLGCDGVARWDACEPVEDRIPHADEHVTDVRPLVVLDPEDARAAEQFARDFFEDWSGCDGSRGISVQNVLRGLTKPPRIPEPGLWGVVMDGLTILVRHSQSDRNAWHCTATGEWVDWDSLTSPTLVRPGIDA